MQKKEFAVLGLGRFGSSLARSLAEDGCEVMAVDRDARAVNDVVDYVMHAQIGDITDKEFVNTLGLSNYDGVIVGVGGNLSTDVMAVILAIEAGSKFVIAKAGSELQARVLRKVGADRVVFPEMETGQRIARQLVYGNYFDAIGLSATHSIMEMGCPVEWAGSSLRALNIRAKYGASVIGIKRNEELIVNPSPDIPIGGDDLLVVLGDNGVLAELNAMALDKDGK